jgi:nitroreductase
LLDIAVYAPNHRMTEPWRFVYMTGQAVADYAAIRRDMALPGFAKLDDATRETAAVGTYRKFANVPAYLLVIMTVNPNAEIAEEDYGACAALIQNFLLLAWAQGIGSCWKTFKNDARLKSFVGLQDTERVAGIIHLGYPAETPTSTRKGVQFTHLP